MPYGHLIAATVMTLGVCQGHSSIANFFSIMTSTSRGPSVIVDLLVKLCKSTDKNTHTHYNTAHHSRERSKNT